MASARGCSLPRSALPASARTNSSMVVSRQPRWSRQVRPHRPPAALWCRVRNDPSINRISPSVSLPVFSKTTVTPSFTRSSTSPPFDPDALPPPEWRADHRRRSCRRPSAHGQAMRTALAKTTTANSKVAPPPHRYVGPQDSPQSGRPFTNPASVPGKRYQTTPQNRAS